MDVKSFLRTEFLNQLTAKTGRVITFSDLDLIEEGFRVNAVNENINRQINESFDKAVQERYQRSTLRTLTEQFIEEFIKTSDNGRNINSQTIATAKLNLKEGRCPIQPC